VNYLRLDPRTQVRVTSILGPPFSGVTSFFLPARSASSTLAGFSPPCGPLRDSLFFVFVRRSKSAFFVNWFFSCGTAVPTLLSPVFPFSVTLGAFLSDVFLSRGDPASFQSSEILNGARFLRSPPCPIFPL